MPIVRKFIPRSSPRHIRDLAADLHTREAAPPPTPSGVEVERLYSLRSLARSRALIGETLASPCPEHSADRGEYCWPSGHGLCSTRFSAALGFPLPTRLKVGELAPFATATRRAFTNRTRPRR